MDYDLPDGGTPPEVVEDSVPSPMTTTEPPGSVPPPPPPPAPAPSDAEDPPTERRCHRRTATTVRSEVVRSPSCRGSSRRPRAGRGVDQGGGARGGPSPPPPGHRHRQPEGWRRQDHHGGEPGRLPGRDRLPHPRGRPRSAGQRLHRPGDQPPGPRGVDVRRAPRRDPDGGLHRGQLGAEPVRRAGQPGSGRRRDRAGAGLQPGAPAPQRHRLGEGGLRLRPHRLSPVARSADDQRLRRRHRGPGARSSASTTRSRAWASWCATSTW